MKPSLIETQEVKTRCRAGEPTERDLWPDEMDGFCVPSAVDGRCLRCQEPVPGAVRAAEQVLLEELRQIERILASGRAPEAIAAIVSGMVPVVRELATDVVLRTQTSQPGHRLARSTLRTLGALETMLQKLKG